MTDVTVPVTIPIPDPVPGPTGPAGPQGPAGPAGTSTLTSPNGSTWTLAVSDTGALSTVPSGGTKPPPSGGSYPPATKLAYHPTTTFALPGLLVPVTDPDTGMQLMRLTDTGYGSGYAKRTAFNCDQTRIWLGRGNKLLDGTTYKDLGKRSVPGNFNWSRTDPNVCFGTQDNVNTLDRWTMDPNVKTVAHTFGGYEHVSLGYGEGNLSDDGRYAALIGRKTNQTWWLLRYDFSNDSVVERSIGGVPYDCTMSPAGTYVVVAHPPGAVGATDAGLWLYATADLKPVRQVTDHISHYDVAYDTQDREVIVCVSDQSAGAVENVVKWVMSTGAKTTQLGRDTAYWYGHISGRNQGRHGYVTLCAYGDYNRTTKAGHDEIVNLRLDDSGTIERVAMSHHASTSSVTELNGDPNYIRSPMACPSPDGQRTLFTSDWGVKNSSYYAFVAGASV
jgi:hypothetical protein